MKIGIPRGLVIYEYPILYEKFFKLLGIDYEISKETDNKILKLGKLNSLDESCLASKIFMGQVASLANRTDIDYIFIPRVCSFKDKETVCVKFYALYDICKNVFKDSNFLTLNIDYNKKNSELKAFIKLGKMLNKPYKEVIFAYYKALKLQKLYNIKKYYLQNKILENKEKIKVLIVSHPYIQYDKFMGKQIINHLKQLNCEPIYASINESNIVKAEQSISKSIYWKNNKSLVYGLEEYKDKVNGIIFLSAFPCGTDALVNELCMRKLKDIPAIKLIVDEQMSDAGIITRLESFVDILEIRKANFKEEEEQVRA